MINRENVHHDNEESQQIMLSLDIDNFEIESFVTGLNEYEKDAIDRGYFLSCLPPPDDTTSIPTVNCLS